MSVAAQADCQSPHHVLVAHLRGRFLLNGRRPGQGFWSQTSSQKNRRSTAQLSGGGEGSCSIGANATWSSANGLVCVTNLLADQPSQGDTVGEHRQPTGIRERLEPLLVAFLAGLGLGHAWGAGVLDPWRSA
jgi:hypothetical protein